MRQETETYIERIYVIYNALEVSSVNTRTPERRYDDSYMMIHTLMVMKDYNSFPIESSQLPAVNCLYLDSVSAPIPLPIFVHSKEFISLFAR